MYGNSKYLTFSNLNLPLSSSSTTSCLNSQLVVDEDDLMWFKNLRKLLCHPLGYKRVYLPLCKVADTPHHIQEEYVLMNHFYGNFRSKTLGSRKMKSIFREV